MQLCALGDASLRNRELLFVCSVTCMKFLNNSEKQFYARNKQAPLVEFRGVHGEFPDDGTYSSGLSELRTIKEP